MGNTDHTIFVYAKDGNIKCLTLEQAKAQQAVLKNEGWIHTTTLDPCRFIESLYESDGEDLPFIINKLAEK